MQSKKMLSESALSLLRYNPEAKRDMAKLFSKSIYTIGVWIRRNDERLTAMRSLAIISDRTGLDPEEILVERDPVAA